MIPNYSKSNSKGARMFANTGHVGAARLHNMLDDGEGEDANEDKTVEEAKDMHHILSIVLESFKELQKTGMKWTFMYKGKKYENITLKFIVNFVKCDTDEADKLCGHYRSRGKVKSICRYCTVATEDCAQVLNHSPHRTIKMIKRLVERNDLQRLKELSQHPIHNAFNDIRFGLQNKRGIYGATPVEMLHGLLLGIFKYTRECFFEQIGPESQAASEIDGLCKLYGSLFGHQSDRDLPNTNFANGIKSGGMPMWFLFVVLMIALYLWLTTFHLLHDKRQAHWQGNDWCFAPHCRSAQV